MIFIPYFPEQGGTRSTNFTTFQFLRICPPKPILLILYNFLYNSIQFLVIILVYIHPIFPSTELISLELFICLCYKYTLFCLLECSIHLRFGLCQLFSSYVQDSMNLCFFCILGLQNVHGQRVDFLRIQGQWFVIFCLDSKLTITS